MRETTIRQHLCVELERLFASPTVFFLTRRNEWMLWGVSQCQLYRTSAAIANYGAQDDMERVATAHKNQHIDTKEVELHQQEKDVDPQL